MLLNSLHLAILVLGALADRLGAGLQIPLGRFDSGTRLHGTVERTLLRVAPLVQRSRRVVLSHQKGVRFSHGVRTRPGCRIMPPGLVLSLWLLVPYTIHVPCDGLLLVVYDVCRV